LAGLVPLEGTLCSLCGEKLPFRSPVPEAAPRCELCRRAAPRFNKAVAYGAYEGTLRELLHVFKYQRVRSAGPLLCRLLHQAVAAAGISGPLLVVPVPLAKGKRRVRGFNQAGEIAEGFARLSPAPSIQLDAKSLVRTRETISQTGLTRRQRQANLRGAFAVIRREKIRGRRILVVDDVMTTGATAGECSRVLLRAGASAVFVATVARATREWENVLAQAAGTLLGGTTGHA
jgi:ComF family protein